MIQGIRSNEHVFKNEVVRLRGGWHVVWQGQMPVTSWTDKSGALAQLALLRSGYTVLAEDGRLRHVGAMRRFQVVHHA